MDYCISSNAQSATLTTLYKLEDTNDYGHRLPVNVRNGSKQPIAIYPNIAHASNYEGKTFTFNIEEAGLLTRIVPYVRLTPLATEAEYDVIKVFSRFASKMALRTQNNIITEIGSEYIQARLENLPASQCFKMNQLTNPSKTWTANEEVEGIIPWFSIFTDTVSNALDTKFIKNCQFDIKINTYEEMGLEIPVGETAPFEALEIILYCFYRNLDEKAYVAYKEKRYGTIENPKEFNMLSYSTYLENYEELLTGSTSVNLKMKCPFPVSRTHFMIVNPVLNQGPTTQEISSFSLSFSGRKLYDNLPMLVLKSDESYLGNTSIRGVTLAGAVSVSPSKGKDIGTINYGEYGTIHSGNSGSLSFGNVSSPILTINLPEAAASDAELRVVHEIFTLLSINPLDGTISSGAST